jgi:hypothetical protein
LVPPVPCQIGICQAGIPAHTTEKGAEGTVKMKKMKNE